MSNLDDALNLTFDSDAGEGLTIRGYFRVLLLTLWNEGESFSGKRPFGNSGWESDLYEPLVKGGFVPGKLDSSGYLEKCNEKKANGFIFDLIEYALKDEATP